MSALVEFIKAFPVLVKLVNSFYESWIDSFSVSDEEELKKKKELRAFYRKKIEEAQTDEEIIKYHRTLHYINFSKKV